MANEHDVGDLIRCTGTFTDDPTTVTFKMLDPSGNTTSYVYGTDVEVVKDSVGVYHVDVSVDEAGVWYYRFEGTGSNQAAEEAKFYASFSAF